MSWYLANENKLIDQFATSSGLGDLSRASATYPALHEFFQEGVTVNVAQCIEELNRLVKDTHDEDVRVTAQGLAGLMRGQKVAVITQGFGYEDDEQEDEMGESLEPPELAQPAKRVAPNSKKKTVPRKKAVARKAKKASAPKAGLGLKRK